MMNSTCWQAPDSPVSAGWAGPGAPSLSAEVLHQKFLQAADCLVGLEEQQDALLQEAGSVVFVRCVNQTLAPIQRQTAMHYFGVNGRILYPLGRRGGKGGARREPSNVLRAVPMCGSIYSEIYIYVLFVCMGHILWNGVQP